MFEAQATNPSPGDFAELVKDDLHSISVCMDMQAISNMGKEAFKNIVKQKVKKAAHHYLVEKKAKHSKVRNLEYINFETQPYLISPLFNDKETSMLAALRSRTHSSFKVNFRHLYGGMVDCPLKCWSPNEIHPEDSQEHLLLCRILLEKFTTEEISETKVEYSDILGNNLKKQKEAVVLIIKLIEIKQEILKQDNPDAVLDPCMSFDLCNRDATLTPVSVVFLSGNK